MAKRAPKKAEPITEEAPRGEAAPARITLLDEVFGQATAKRTLGAAMRSGRVHHAWVFHGPAGVGKMTAAVAFAAALLDPTTGPDLAGNLAPEPGSETQRLVRAGSHPDLHVVTKELAAISRDATIRDRKQLTIPKDVIEEFLLEPAARTRVVQSGTAVGKVFILDEAELMDARTQNVLLKTLEEPPEGTVIILVTASEDRLLTTIRSRSQRVPFAPLTEAEMRAWMSGVGMEGAEGEWLLRFAAGSPGSALVAKRNGLWAWQEAVGPILAQIDRGVFSPDLGATLAKLIDERAAAWVKANPDASKDAANKAWARRMLSFLGEHYRGVLRRGLERRGSAGEAAEAPDVRRSLHAIEALRVAETHLATNVNMALALENLGAQLAAEPEPI